MRDQGNGRGAGGVFTIASGAPFVDALAAGLLAAYGDHQDGDDGRDGGGSAEGCESPMLPSVLILLPTRRSCRALADAFLRQSGGRPLLLPRISPLGDVDEDDFALGDRQPEWTADLSLPPAIPPLRRQLLLTRLILAAHGDTTSYDQAARLAAELARLLDQVHAEDVDLERLSELVPERLAEHWQRTLDFLGIVTEHWPRVLAEAGCLDGADRRNRLLRAQAQAWRAAPPATPVIAAGSTGSVPATAELLATIAALPAGAVVLPGLDRDADDDTWAALQPTHPQFGMARLIERLGVDRRDVRRWPAAIADGPGPERSALINLALKPAATASHWRDHEPLPSSAVDSVTRIDAPGPDEEARTIALLMRGALETPGQTTALVTPDRVLARRVAVELERWSILVDDSGGRPLAQTPAGSFLRLTVGLVAEAFAPVPLLAALKHPLAAGGQRPAAFRSHVRRLERTVLRGPRPAPGTAGLLAALAEAVARAETRAHAENEQRAVLEGRVAGHTEEAERDPADRFIRLRRLVADLERMTAPLTEVFVHREASLADLLTGHVEAAERLAASDEAPGSARLWAGEAGEVAAMFISDLRDAVDAFPLMPTASYPALLDALMTGQVVRPRYGRHPRLAIWGPLEARLQRADVMILGGLNEGTWPPRVDASPWMSRPMMTDLGLSLPERRIGLSAHDFTQCFAAPNVVMTRARRVEGTPTVESRWLLRLANMVRATDATGLLDGGAAWLEWQRSLDAAQTLQPTEPPAPSPPVSARPRRLSVTWVERWMRDPYSVYARYVLKLKPLDPLDADPGAAEYGSFVHRALDLFIAENEGALPPDALDRLLSAGRRTIGAQFDRPGVRAFWWPRFERIARWFVDHERRRRSRIRSIATEVPGRLCIVGPEGPFTLTATADRIDLLCDGRLAIVDYKTGAIPSEREVAAGFAPQLPLEAAMAAAGAFQSVPGTAVGELEYWRLTGGRPPGDTCALKQEPPRLATAALEGLHALVARYDLEETPYLSRPRPGAALRYSDYEHLARVKEWSALGSDGAE